MINHWYLQEEDYRRLATDSLAFVEGCKASSVDYVLAPGLDASPFTRCFAIFIYHLIGNLRYRRDSESLEDKIIEDLFAYKQERALVANLESDKAFLQLLCMSLSALEVLNSSRYELEAVIEELVPSSVVKLLESVGAGKGVPTSGNIAMCTAIILIYAKRTRCLDADSALEEWVSFHLNTINGKGFWSSHLTPYLQFQNGYHQYEIFEYLELDIPQLNDAVELVHLLADSRGQFAPYYGGSGCYDYDAVSILTFRDRDLTFSDKQLLSLTARSILDDQDIKGGFSESKYLPVLHRNNLFKQVGHVVRANRLSLFERSRYFISMARSQNNLCVTHWTSKHRNWGQPNLWDTWFRLLTLARIDIALNPANRARWHFIDFPGLGYKG
ncbi:hypothetical protein OAL14_00465 [Gammaproteobacteria bacterium]|nr:hypothetical protein [Gammaproteobacteria bacterium]